MPSNPIAAKDIVDSLTIWDSFKETGDFVWFIHSFIELGEEYITKRFAIARSVSCVINHTESIEWFHKRVVFGEVSSRLGGVTCPKCYLDLDNL